MESLPGIDWVEAVAENLCPDRLPDSLVRLRERGVTVVPHGVSLGLGGADRPDARRLADLAERAEALGSPLVTEHIAFVRAGGERTASPLIEAGHLLPVPRTRDALRVLCENVRIAQDSLPVPLAVENIAALISWPDEEMSEGRFLAELVERTGVRLLIDVANLHTNHVNRGEDPARALDELPVEAIAYVHVAGGVERDGVWHDTHAHPVSRPVLDVLAELRSRVDPPGVLLERDDDFPPAAELAGELTAIRETIRMTEAKGAARAARTEAVPAEGAADGEGEVSEDGEDGSTDPARQRLALAETSLLSALVAGTPVPEGFDRRRLRVQSRALSVKRAGVVAKVAPELPEILGVEATARRSSATPRAAPCAPVTAATRSTSPNTSWSPGIPRATRPGGACPCGGRSAPERDRPAGRPVSSGWRVPRSREGDTSRRRCRRTGAPRGHSPLVPRAPHRRARDAPGRAPA